MPGELVLDASAAIKALTETGAAADTLKRRLLTDDVHTPHLFDAEVGDILRKQALLGRIEPPNALGLLLSLNSIIDDRYPHHSLVRAAWELRDRVRFYDAMYVALAARLRMPLLTADVRLSRAHDLPCAVEVV